MLSACLGLFGVAVIEAPELVEAFSRETGPLLAGGALVLTSAIVSGWANVINKKHLGGVSPFINVWGQTFVGSAFLLAASFVFEKGAPVRWTPTSTGALVYLAVIGTALPFVGLFWLIRRVPVSVIGTIPVVDTVIAVVLGNLILGETFPPRVLAGGAFILLGVLLVAVSRKEPRLTH